MKPPLRHAQLNKIFRAIFNNMPDCMLVVDEDLHIVLCNWKGSFADVPDELKRQRQKLHCYEILYPGQKSPCADCPVHIVLKNEQEITLKKIDPRAGHLEIRAFPLSGKNRRVALVGEQVCNVSSTEKLREKLTASENKLQTLFNLLPQMIFELDKNGIIIFANRVGLSTFGYSQTDLATGPHVTQMVIPEHRQPLMDYLQDVLKGVGTQSNEYTAQRKDLTTFSAMVFAEPEYCNGVVVGAVGMLIDISEHKALEEQLIKSQKMETVGRMAQGLAHDFNNLLFIVSGYSELLLKHLEDPTLSGWAEAIRDAGAKATTFTEELHNLGRESIGRPSAVDLNTTLATLDKLVRQALGHRISLTLQLNPELPLIWANQKQIEQIILNLTINARDAMPEGGQLTITTEKVIEPTDNFYIKLTISDTGCGMDADTRAHIFEPFFTTKEKGKGTGLGLSIVYTIVKNHGGRIELDSTPNQGTTFAIYLPCQKDFIEKSALLKTE